MSKAGDSLVSRLIIVSNRVACPTQQGVRAGGLAVAMHEALDRCGGMWFGWSGQTTDETPGAPDITEAGNVTYVTVDLQTQDYQAYYIGYANGTLWPLFHNQLGLIKFTRASYEGYLRVNAQMAATLAPLIRPDDTIWVQDYHLIPFGRIAQAGRHQPDRLFPSHAVSAPAIVRDAAAPLAVAAWSCRLRSRWLPDRRIPSCLPGFCHRTGARAVLRRRRVHAG